VSETSLQSIRLYLARRLRTIAKRLGDGKLAAEESILRLASEELSLAGELIWLLSTIQSEAEKMPIPNLYVIRRGTGTSPTSTPG